jgi:hypothetical protein
MVTCPFALLRTTPRQEVRAMVIIRAPSEDGVVTIAHVSMGVMQISYLIL